MTSNLVLWEDQGTALRGREDRRPFATKLVFKKRRALVLKHSKQIIYESHHMSSDDNNAAMKALLIEKVVHRAKQKDGGRTSCPSNQWSIIAQAMLAMTQPGAFDEERAVEVLLSSVRQSFKSSKSFIVPDVCPISASGLEKGENASHKRKYEETTMSKSDSFGAFVAVKSYTQFCLDMTRNLDLKDKSMQIVRQPIETLFPRERGKSTPSEKPRSAQLARLLQSEVGGNWGRVRASITYRAAQKAKGARRGRGIHCSWRHCGNSLIQAGVKLFGLPAPVISVRKRHYCFF